MIARRLALARFSGGFLLSLLERGVARTFDKISGIPDGAVLLHVSLGSNELDATCVFEHRDFDVVEEGQPIPALRVSLKSQADQGLAGRVTGTRT